MNRALYIVLIPSLVVAAGYVVVLRAAGISPGYARLLVPVVLFFGAIWWLGRRSAHRAKAGGQQ
jgi:hypothetical protein